MNNDDRKEKFPKKGIPSSYNFPSDTSMCPYTTNFKEIHDNDTSPQLKFFIGVINNF